MHESDLVGVHETRIAHHVAPVGQIHRQHRPPAVADRARAVIVQRLVVVGVDVPPRIHGLDVLQKLLVDGHHVLEAPVDGALLDHPDLPVALQDGGFDLAHLLVDEDPVVHFPVQNLLACLNDALGTEGVGRARPSQRGLGLLPRFQQGFIGPFGSEGRIGSVFVEELNDVEGGSCQHTQRHVHVLHRSVHGIFLSLKMAWGVCARAKPKVSPVSLLSKRENKSFRPRPYSESKHHSISTHHRHRLCRWFWRAIYHGFSHRGTETQRKS